MPDRDDDLNTPVPLFGGQDVSEWDPEALQTDPEFYRNGGISLSDSERQALGEIKGKKVLVVTAGMGEDAASLINLGAKVTVIDDKESLGDAQELLNSAGLDAMFVEGNPRELPEQLRAGTFDVVYSSFGSIDWVTDLGVWAEGLSGALKQGGRLVVYDEHPFAHVFDEQDSQLVPAHSYFGVAMEAMLESGLDLLNAEADPEFDTTAETDPASIAALTEDLDEDDIDLDLDDGLAEPDWTLGDLITSLGTNGLATVSLLEFPESDRFETAMDCLDTVDPVERDRIPSALLLVAVKL
jgi:ubiquinone/menaquinone biosynthesis C-methylase UbiE